MAFGDCLKRGGDDRPPDDFQTFRNALNELKLTGCTVLVVGNTSRELFTRTSGQLLGDADVLRHRILAVTDAPPESVADRLPDPAKAARSLSETTRLLNHAGAPRTASTATGSATRDKLTDIEQTRVIDSELTGLGSALCEAADDVAAEAYRLRPADLRVGIDSLGPLLDHYDVDAVETLLDDVGECVRSHDAMAHFVLPRSYDDEAVQRLVPAVDAVVELRAVDPEACDHDAQQRWHIPEQNVETEWIPL